VRSFIPRPNAEAGLDRYFIFALSKREIRLFNSRGRLRTTLLTREQKFPWGRQIKQIERRIFAGQHKRKKYIQCKIQLSNNITVKI